MQYYTGDFLPNMVGESWVNEKNMHYKKLFDECVNALCLLHTEEKNYEAVIDISSYAADIDSDGDWQV